MPFPFPRPSFSPKPSFPSKPPAAPEKKSSGGWGLAESLGLRGAPPKEAGTQPKPPGIFGPKGYTSFREQEWLATKAPDKPLPGTGQKLFKEGRTNVVKDIEKYAKEVGQTHGLSEQSWRGVVKPYMEKKAYELRSQGKINEAQELGRKMQYYEDMATGK